MLLLGAVSCAAARRWGALGCPVGLSLGVSACSRHVAAPVAVDAPLERPSPPAAPVMKDAAVDQALAIDAQPDLVGPPHSLGHRTAPIARPVASGFRVSGSITKADAETVLHGARAKLNACYDKEQAKNAANALPRGRVIFRLSIDGRGRGVDAHFSDGLRTLRPRGLIEAAGDGAAQPVRADGLDPHRALNSSS